MNSDFNILIQKRKEIDKLKNEIFDISKHIFSKTTKEIFDKYRDVESFSWTQYTPYLGGVFTANIQDIKINNKSYYSNSKNDNILKIYEEIFYFLNQFDDDFYFKQFGNNAEIIITREGTNINEYNNCF